MAKRKRTYANGEGSITFVKGRRSPWWARLPASYDENGKEYRPSVGFFKSKKEAKAALDEYQGLSDIKTFKELYEIYKTTDKFLKLSDKTKVRYDDSFKAFRPIWNKNIMDIKVSQMQACIDRKVKEGYIVVENGKKVRKDYSKDSISRLKHLATNVYKIAEQNDLIDKNRGKLLEVKGVERENVKTIFYQNDIKTLYNSIPNNPDARHILCMIFTGMRTSEYLNLTKDMINFKRKTIKNFGIKTETGRARMMFIHDLIEPILKELYDESKTGYIVERIQKQKSKEKIIHPSDNTFRNKMFKPALEKAGLEEATPYKCRYTFATIAHISGMNDYTIMKLMGHKSIETTASSYIQIVDDFLLSQLQSFNFSLVYK